MKIEKLLAAHTALRTENCINLMASENVMSPAAMKALTNDLSNRYYAEAYGGTIYVRKLFSLVKELACQLFKAEKAFITPLSGNLADLAVLFAFSSPGDKIGTLSFSDGGYPLDYAYFHRTQVPLAYSREQLTLDSEKSCEILEDQQPPLVFLGCSFIPFPHPIREIAECVHSYGGIVAYDASHPLGLIAGGEFQDPLREGADILLGSTHKSFPGPQGGIILTYEPFAEKLDRIIGEDRWKHIVLFDSVHNGRVAALGITIEEMILNGEQYAKQIVKNSHGLAKGLSEGDVTLLTRTDGKVTCSHQVNLSIPDFEIGARLRNKLEKYRIFTDMGMRFGTSEVARKGYTKDEMIRVGAMISEILQDNTDGDLKQDLVEQIRGLAHKHASVVI
ncbi:MAG: hypothetical protein ACE5OZ_12530 [Candidatus Heimdallarchaeota archaeon]